MIIKDKKFLIGSLSDKDSFELGSKNYLMQIIPDKPVKDGPVKDSQTPDAGATPTVDTEKNLDAVKNVVNQTTGNNSADNQTLPTNGDKLEDSGSWLPSWLGGSLGKRGKGLAEGTTGQKYSELETEEKKAVIGKEAQTETAAIQATGGIQQADVTGQYSVITTGLTAEATKYQADKQLSGTLAQANATIKQGELQLKGNIITSENQLTGQVFGSAMQAYMTSIQNKISDYTSMTKKIEDEHAGGKLAASITINYMLPALIAAEEIALKVEYEKQATKYYQEDVQNYMTAMAEWRKKNPVEKTKDKSEKELKALGMPELKEFKFNPPKSTVFETYDPSVIDPNAKEGSQDPTQKQNRQPIIKVPKVTEFRVSELGFERQNPEEGALSEFKLYYVPAHNGNAKSIVATNKEADHMQEVVTIRKGEHGKEKEYYFKNADGTLGKKLDAADQNKLMAKASCLNPSQPYAVFVDKEEAEEAYFKKSVSKDEQFFMTIFSKKNEHYAKEMSALLAEWQNGTSLLVVLFKAVSLYLRSKEIGIAGKGGIKDELNDLSHAIEATGKLTDADREVLAKFSANAPEIKEENKQKIFADALQAMTSDGKVEPSELEELNKKLERSGKFSTQELDQLKTFTSAIKPNAEFDNYKFLLIKSNDKNLTDAISNSLKDFELSSQDKDNIKQLINSNPNLSDNEKISLTQNFDNQKSLGESSKLLFAALNDDGSFSKKEIEGISKSLTKEGITLEQAIKDLISPIANLSPEISSTEANISNFENSIKTKYEDAVKSQGGGGGNKNKKQK
jgi:hypothetical protein